MGNRIMVVEDNEKNLYLVTRLLEKRGHQVIPARDGSEAIKLLSHDRPTLILMDIQLPGMDGYAVARQLRSNRELDHIPIVAVTSYAMAGDRERVLAAGCNGYMEKPINPYTFAEEVERHLPDPDTNEDGD